MGCWRARCEGRASAVGVRAALVRWLLAMEDPKAQAIAFKVVAARYDVCALLLEGRSLLAIKQRIAKDIADEQKAMCMAERQRQERDVVNALWDAVDTLPLIRTLRYDTRSN